jgi:hypothetical protein
MKNVEGLQPNLDCPVCRHPQRVAAASMKELKATDEEIATALQLDEVDVTRHFTTCIKVLSLEDSEDLDAPFDRSQSDHQLQVLLQNATELYHSAVLQGNMVAGSSALAVRLRCLNEIGRRGETREKRAGLLDGVDPTNPASWPPELAHFWRLWSDDLLRRIDESKSRRALEEA